MLGEVDPGAVEDLIGLCVQYDRIRGHAADRPPMPGGADTHGAVPPDGTSTGGAAVIAARPGGTAPDAGQAAGTAAEVLAMLEHQMLATVLQIVSGPGGVASFLRRNLLGKGLNGPSLPLDVGQP